MSLDSVAADLQQQNAALERELAELQRAEQEAGSIPVDIGHTVTCSPEELQLLRRIADAVVMRDTVALERLRDELMTQIAESRVKEDTYVELCGELLAEATRLRQLCTQLEG